MLDNIPNEMLQLSQWICATKSDIKRADKIPINPLTGGNANPIDSGTWTTFANACNGRTPAYPHVSFVLSSADPYTIIDLDDPYDLSKEWDDEKRLKLAGLNQQIMNTFESYTELSQSGTGIHIIVRGSIPSGVNRDTVELYSTQRHMICTGNVVKQLPIVDCQEALNQLFSEMKPDDERHASLSDIAESKPDQEIINIAMGAENGDKFISLCNGDLSEYPSQSEADLALMSIIAYYSQSNEQCRRIFRMTELGKRAKAVRNDTYLDFTLKLVRSKQPPPVDLTAILKRAAEVAEFNQAPIEPAVIPTEYVKPQESKCVYPPGLIGEIAEYIYRSAVRPVKEVGLIAALGLMAGLTGRQYNISGTGLNMYLIFLAKTGRGKEGIANGIDRITSEVQKSIPQANRFRGPSAFASGPALVKTMGEKPVFLSILGEFGLTLQQICDPRANGAEVTLRKALLDLYQKSGWFSVLRASVYSDREKNTDDVRSPALSLLGESTPSTFLEGLGAQHIADGLIPRFSILEYTGPRPYLNENNGFAPSDILINKMVDIFSLVLTMEANDAHMEVKMDSEAREISNAFEIWTTDVINNATNQSLAELWNRAHLKALKLSALIAVGVNISKPIVTKECMDWAIGFVKQDIDTLLIRFEQGDIGVGEEKQLVDLRRKVSAYFAGKPPLQWRKFHNAGIIPIRFIRQSLCNVASFKKDQKGSTRALAQTIEVMIANGELVEIPAQQARNKFNTTTKLYALGDEWTGEKQ